MTLVCDVLVSLILGGHGII